MAGGSDAHESTAAILAAFLANLGIAAAKFAGFLITGSSSLLAESIHSVADSSNQGLLYLGGRQAARAPTELHQFGYGRVRYFWAFVVAVVLFSDSPRWLIAAAGLAASAFAGYVINRTVGLPQATGDIGNWTEPLGLASMVVEGLVVAVAIAGLRTAGAARRLVPG